MTRLMLGGLLIGCGIWALGVHASAQGGRGRGAAPGLPIKLEPTYFMGCVSGGNLQPVEQPFVLEPAEPFVLTDVVTRTNSTEFAPTPYRLTGVNMTPWLGLRVKVEGVVSPGGTPGASDPKQLPEIKATRVTSIWGTCPSRPAWTPVPKS